MLREISWDDRDPEGNGKNKIKAEKVWIAPKYVKYACLRRPHLYRVCTGGDIADHQPTAPLLGCICITGVDEQSVVDLKTLVALKPDDLSHSNTC